MYSCMSSCRNGDNKEDYPETLGPGLSVFGGSHPAANFSMEHQVIIKASKQGDVIKL